MLMDSIISIKDLTKTYANGFEALKTTNLEIRARRDLRRARPERRGQDDADQHRLRHREPDRRHGYRRRPRQPKDARAARG